MANPVMMIGDNPACGIQKRLISPGKGDLPSFVDNDKVCINVVCYVAKQTQLLRSGD